MENFFLLFHFEFFFNVVYKICIYQIVNKSLYLLQKIYHIQSYLQLQNRKQNSKQMLNFFSKDETNKHNQERIKQLQNENESIKEQYQNLLKQNQKLKCLLRQHLFFCKLDLDEDGENENGVNGIENRLSIPEKPELLKLQQHLDDERNENPRSQGERSPGNLHLAKTSSNDGNNKNLVTIPQNQTISCQVTPKRMRTSSRSSRNSSINQKYFSLIEGCFIIEKKKCFANKTKNSLQEMIEFVYPEELIKTEKACLEMLLKYVFTEVDMIKVQDDQFNSRKNEIFFGTPFDDYLFAFEASRSKRQTQIPEIMKQMGILRKKYYHILVKPEIIDRTEMENKNGQTTAQNSKQENEKKNQQMPVQQNDNQNSIQNKDEQNCEYFYQTQIIFGFISPFPLRLFFQQLHRTIQQQLKFSQFSIDEQKQQVFNLPINRKNKYQILGNIMKKLYDQQYKINKFPLKSTFATGITKVQMNIPTIINLKEIQDTFLNHVLSKHDPTSICKLLHYVLSEKSIIIIAKDKKSLNELFQAIRIMIKPFIWIFHCIYLLSSCLQHFLTSPIPTIIGKLQQKEEDEEKQKETQTTDSQMQYSDFCIVKMTGERDELKEKDLYYKTIKKLKKQWDKANKQKNQDKATLIHKYVHSLKVFIEKGVINSEPTNFHQQFIDSQMVSYFKDLRDEI